MSDLVLSSSILKTREGPLAVIPPGETLVRLWAGVCSRPTTGARVRPSVVFACILSRLVLQIISKQSLGTPILASRSLIPVGGVFADVLC